MVSVFVLILQKLPPCDGALRKSIFAGMRNVSFRRIDKKVPLRSANYIRLTIFYAGNFPSECREPFRQIDRARKYPSRVFFSSSIPAESAEGMKLINGSSLKRINHLMKKKLSGPRRSGALGRSHFHRDIATCLSYLGKMPEDVPGTKWKIYSNRKTWCMLPYGPAATDQFCFSKWFGCGRPGWQVYRT